MHSSCSFPCTTKNPALRDSPSSAFIYCNSSDKHSCGQISCLHENLSELKRQVIWASHLTDATNNCEACEKFCEWRVWTVTFLPLSRRHRWFALSSVIWQKSCNIVIAQRSSQIVLFISFSKSKTNHIVYGTGKWNNDFGCFVFRVRYPDLIVLPRQL